MGIREYDGGVRMLIVHMKGALNPFEHKIQMTLGLTRGSKDCFPFVLNGLPDLRERFPHFIREGLNGLDIMPEYFDTVFQPGKNKHFTIA